MISIGMTTYNGEKYLREQIDSILQQTFDDFELIICDDCSTDNTKQILQEYAEKDKRIKLHFNEKNLGFKKNFEKAISFCTREYIALTDQDDIWLPNHLQDLIDNIKDKSMISGNAIMVDSNNCELGMMLNEVDKFYNLPEDNKILYHIMLLHNSFQGSASLLQKDFLKNVLPIPEKIKYHDAWFAACACFENGLDYIKEPILRYRQHGNNISGGNHQLKLSPLNKYKRFFNALFKKKLIYTDRFAYCDELKNRYGLDNSDFKNIYNFIKNAEKKRINFSNILMLWKNFKYVTTTNSRKGFFKILIKWFCVTENK